MRHPSFTNQSSVFTIFLTTKCPCIVDVDGIDCVPSAPMRTLTSPICSHMSDTVSRTSQIIIIRYIHILVTLNMVQRVVLSVFSILCDF